MILLCFIFVFMAGFVLLSWKSMGIGERFLLRSFYGRMLELDAGIISCNTRLKGADSVPGMDGSIRERIKPLRSDSDVKSLSWSLPTNIG